MVHWQKVGRGKIVLTRQTHRNVRQRKVGVFQHITSSKLSVFGIFCHTYISRPKGLVCVSFVKA